MPNWTLHNFSATWRVGLDVYAVPSAPIDGDWLLEASWQQVIDDRALLLAAANDRSGSGCYLTVEHGLLRLMRVTDHTEIEVRRWPFGAPCRQLRLLRRGAAYRIWVNGEFVGWDDHPLSDLSADGSLTRSHPEQEWVGFRGTAPSEVHLRTLPTMRACTANPVIMPNSDEPWRAAEAFPGALLKVGECYFLYLNGSDNTDGQLEGGGRARIGLGTSLDLRRWQVDSRGPIVLAGGAGAWDSIYMMAGSTVVTPDGRYALTYAGFDGKKWGGIGLALANTPKGPFVPLPAPVLQPGPQPYDSLAIHEHCLIQVGQRYALLYTGFDGHGDCGSLAFSDNLMDWTKAKTNPVFGRGAAGDWDAWHVRPRGIVEHRGVYYMLYEGAAGWRDAFVDSIGLAYSLDLVHWQRCTTNPILPPAAGEGFDTILRQWATPIVVDDTLYVLYAGCRIVGHGKKQGHYGTGLASISLKELERLVREY